MPESLAHCKGMCRRSGPFRDYSRSPYRRLARRIVSVWMLSERGLRRLRPCEGWTEDLTQQAQRLGVAPDVEGDYAACLVEVRWRDKVHDGRRTKRPDT